MKTETIEIKIRVAGAFVGSRGVRKRYDLPAGRHPVTDLDPEVIERLTGLGLATLAPSDDEGADA